MGEKNACQCPVVALALFVLPATIESIAGLGVPMYRMFAAAVAALVGLAAFAGWAGHAVAQKRVAFVAGTDTYDNLDPRGQLQRAVNDARAMREAFKSLGFEVIAAENLTRGQFNEHFQKFLEKVATGDTAAVYYAGHGVEIEGLNFLLPRDVPNIKFGRQEQIKRESLSIAEILLDLRGRKPEITLVILDACRDNPLLPDELRSAGSAHRGLAPLKGEPPTGTFIMYSAGAGESALDRLPGSDPDRLNSIFTRKLIPLLTTRGLALHDMARKLREDVIKLASTVPHTQRPAYYDGVVGKFCLAGCEGGAPALASPAEPSGASQRLSEAAEAWDRAKDTTSVAVLEAYMARYKDTFYAELARARADEIKKKDVRLSVEDARTASLSVNPPSRPRTALESCSVQRGPEVNQLYCTSSVLRPTDSISYDVGNLFDGRGETAWVEGSSGHGIGQWIVVEFDATRRVSAVTVRNGYVKNPDIFAKNGRVRELGIVFSQGERKVVTLRDTAEPQTIALSPPVVAHWLQFVIQGVYEGSKYSDTAISELVVRSEKVR